MRRHTLISQAGPAIMLLAGIGFAVASVTTLDLGSVRRMGPGAYPLLVSGVLIVLALLCLLQNLAAPMAVERADPIAVIGVVAGVGAFAFVTPFLGVLPATAIAVLATGSAIPGFRWPARMALAVAVTLGVWLIFVRALGMPFVPFRWP
jgi:hypothetical protein